MKNKTKTLILNFLLIALPSLCLAQTKEKTFLINGYINADTGKVYLNMVSETVYYPLTSRNYEAIVSKGKFIFKGSMDSPEAFTIQYDNKYESEFIIVTPGVQIATINLSSSNHEMPIIVNSVVNDYKNYHAFYKAYRIKYELYNNEYKKADSLYKEILPDSVKLRLSKKFDLLQKESDNLLLEYTRINPRSNIAFWKLIRLMGFGYENIFDKIYLLFDDSLKKSYAGTVLISRLKKASLTGSNKPFPSFKFDSIPFDKSMFSLKKYTLVDFWYSRCGPCIAQFPALKKVYDKYKHRGLEIIGVSTDKESDHQNWINAIKKYNLIWPQVWDKNGEQSKAYSIATFPSNLLVDNNGVIVGKNIQPDEIEEFMRINIDGIK